MGGATISFWHVLVWGIVRPWLSCVGNTCRARSAATVLPLAHPLLMHPYVMYVRDIQRSGDAEAMLGARSACAEWGCGCQPPAVPKPRKIPTNPCLHWPSAHQALGTPPAALRTLPQHPHSHTLRGSDRRSGCCLMISCGRLRGLHLGGSQHSPVVPSLWLLSCKPHTSAGTPLVPHAVK